MKPIEKQTKAELIKTVDILRRHEARLLRDIAKLEKQLAPAPQRDEQPSHVTPLPANAYGPFPWEPKQ